MSIASISDRTKPGSAPPGTAAPLRGVAADPSSLMRVVSALQTELALDALLLVFARQVERFVPRASLTYSEPSRSVRRSVGGEPGRHSCEYGIALEGAPLGTLRFARERRFRKEELETLETLLSLLVYPLRNALLYFDAVNAAGCDPLTGLRNRKGLEEALDKEIVRAQRYEHAFSLLFLDLDHFKRVNDAHGHLGGDTLLIKFSALLERLVRDCDCVFRFGGEEFAVLLPSTALPGAEQLAERLRAETEALQVQYNGRRIPLTTSIGVAPYLSGDSRAALVERADRALYRAKSVGRNRVITEVADPAGCHGSG